MSVARIINKASNFFPVSVHLIDFFNKIKTRINKTLQKWSQVSKTYKCCCHRSKLSVLKERVGLRLIKCNARIRRGEFILGKYWNSKVSQFKSRITSLPIICQITRAIIILGVLFVQKVSLMFTFNGCLQIASLWKNGSFNFIFLDYFPFSSANHISSLIRD